MRPINPMLYFPGFSAPSGKVLRGDQWPGNMRALKNVVERSVYPSQNLDEPIKVIPIDLFESALRPIQADETVTIRTIEDSLETLGTKVVPSVPQFIYLPIDFKKYVLDCKVDRISNALIAS